MCGCGSYGDRAEGFLRLDIGGPCSPEWFGETWSLGARVGLQKGGRPQIGLVLPYLSSLSRAWSRVLHKGVKQGRPLGHRPPELEVGGARTFKVA